MQDKFMLLDWTNGYSRWRFCVHEVTRKQGIAPTWSLKTMPVPGGKVMPQEDNFWNDPPIIDWEVFNNMIKAQFYLIVMWRINRLHGITSGRGDNLCIGNFGHQVELSIGNLLV